MILIIMQILLIMKMIENQYFIGSEYLYNKNVESKSNRIPEAILLKILQNMRANNPFQVYIILPYCPAGELGTKMKIVEKILANQYYIKKEMYTRIHEELKFLKKLEE